MPAAGTLRPGIANSDFAKVWEGGAEAASRTPMPSRSAPRDWRL